MVLLKLSPQIGPADLAQIFFIEPARGADADCDHGLLRGGLISADRRARPITHPHISNNTTASGRDRTWDDNHSFVL